MATPKIPALLDPAQYALQLTPGTYTDLVAGTLGNTAHPSDGFDAALSASAARHAANMAALPGLDADVLALGQVTPYFDGHPAANLATTLQPVSDAIDASLADYTGIVTPAPQSGGESTPVPSTAVLGQPTEVQASDLTGYSVLAIKPALVVRVGDAAQVIGFISRVYLSPGSVWDRISLIAGDAAVFSPSFTPGTEFTLNPTTYREGVVTVNAAKAGHFWSVILLHDYANTGPGVYFGVVVDILA
jgi:hypothetical protein